MSGLPGVDSRVDIINRMIDLQTVGHDEMKHHKRDEIIKAINGAGGGWEGKQGKEPAGTFCSCMLAIKSALDNLRYHDGSIRNMFNAYVWLFCSYDTGGAICIYVQGIERESSRKQGK